MTSIISYGVIAQYDDDIIFLRNNFPKVDIHYNNTNKVVLITAKNKYIIINDQNKYIDIENEILIPTQEEITLITTVMGSSTKVIPKLYFFQFTDPVSSISQIPPIPLLKNIKKKLSIMTFNLAYNVQANTLTGSEKSLVKKCQQRYPIYGGYSEAFSTNKPILSQCTINAILYMVKHRSDLIGLQEVHNYYFKKIMEAFNTNSKEKYESIGGNGSVQFLYNSNILGKGILLSDPDLYIIDKGRDMIVVWFPTIKLLAINLHAPHKIDLNKEITKIFNTVIISDEIKKTINRIIVTGDFNDTYYDPLKELTFLGKKLKQHGDAVLSCCYDSNYQLKGDYIFDSDYNNPGFYGISADTYKILMSDHYPVIYTEL